MILVIKEELAHHYHSRSWKKSTSENDKSGLIAREAKTIYTFQIKGKQIQHSLNQMKRSLHQPLIFLVRKQYIIDLILTLSVS